MQQEIILTGDGSHSVLSTALNVTYHSTFGAIQESAHIFIDCGLKQFTDKKSLSILEVGFGTGLNTLLSYIVSEHYPVDFYYEAIEKYPLPSQLTAKLNYPDILNRTDLYNVFTAMHKAEEKQQVILSNNFCLVKRYDDIQNCFFQTSFDIVYFDAFDPIAQPELWTTPIFTKLYAVMNEGGILLTYCSKTIVRHAMEAAGFRVEKVRGPKGKREIVRAKKSLS